ncbi:MAG: hypothetical protein LC107_12120 [Chitinophagales bacterium]|nr:hypothetical protein [Chitinophagales bacterium]
MRPGYWNLYILMIVFVSFGFTIRAQEQLLLEVKNQVEAIKFVPGDHLMYRTVDDKAWRNREIIRLIPEANLILFDDGMVEIDEIKSIRIHNYFYKGFGKMITGFGATWLLFGGILNVSGKEDFSWTNVAIGAAGLGIGQLVVHVAGQRTYKLNKHTRLRLVDVSMRINDERRIPTTP